MGYVRGSWLMAHPVRPCRSELVLMLVSVGLRIKMGNCWFIRWTHTSMGSYLTPNFTG